MTTPASVSTRRVSVVAGAAFFAIGMLAALGPTLPDFARKLDITRAEAGTLFIALFIGSVASQLITGAITDRVGHRWALTGGLAVMALGFVGVLLSPSLPLAFACMVLAGFGDGVLVVSANVMVAEVFEKRSAAALNGLNIFFGLGAITGPALVGASLGVWGTSLPVLWAMVALFCLLIPLAATLRIPLRRHVTGESGAAAGSILASPALWLLGAILLIYVGIEVGTGGWTATYMERAAATPPEVGALVASGFYVALTIGRALGSILGTRLTSDKVLLISLAGTLLGGTLLYLSIGNAPMMVGSIVLLGFSLGPVFPTVVAITAARFPWGPGKAAGIVMAMGSVGGAILPWLQGVIIEGAGTVSATLFLAGCALLMLIAYGALQTSTRRSRFKVQSSRFEL